jgi:uncharacterized protein YndB with AHSA1/START domain
MTTQTGLEPIRKTIEVAAPLETAFETFTEQISAWWPLDAHSIGAGRDDTTTESVTVEGRVDGRLFERLSNGQEADWGRLLVWEPPERLVFTWHPGADDPSTATEIEVRFAPSGGGTRVELEHRGWERLGERAAQAQQGYDSGWDKVLARYAEAASA